MQDTPVVPLGDVLAQVILLVAYRESSASRKRLFPSDGALEWWVRSNREQLISRGAMLKIRGTWHVHADRFDRAVLEISQGALSEAA